MKNKNESVAETPSRARVRAPRLRFPEFRDKGNWRQENIGYLFSERIETNCSDLPLLSLTEKDGVIPQSDSNRKDNSNSDKSKYLKVCPGDIAYNTMRMWEGRCALVGLMGLVSPAYTICKPHNDVFGAFFFYYFKTSKMIERFRRYSQGLVKDTLNLKFEQFAQIEIPYPEYPEQQKIAACLSSLDTLIAAHEKKLENLKAYKKGIMQRLFPSEGEKTPRLRFPGFRGNGPWVKQNNSQLLQKIVNPVIVEEDKLYKQIGIRSHGKGIFHKDSINGQELGNKRVFWVEENAFVVNIVFAWEQAVAVTSANEKGMIASHRFPMYKAIDEKCTVDFIMHFFLTRKGKLLLGIASPGGAGRNRTLGQKEFDDISFFIPKHVDEQRKIAACLSSLDELIAAQTRKIEELKDHKRGLMQGLFPETDNEVHTS